MLDEQALKQRLQAIASDNYKAPTRPELYPLVLAMGTYTGSLDPELRDDLIYTTMATWIARDVFEAKKLNEILMVSLNEQHLFLGLGEMESDTVFTRTFSMLIVAAILNAHRRRPFLPGSELQVIKHKLLRYLDGERDLRGYVPVKGWAHSIAHAADALDELVQCEALDVDDVQEVLTAMRSLIGTAETVYICEEDERLVTAVLSAWQRAEVSDEDIIQWLEAVTAFAGSSLSLPDGYCSFINCKNFVRSLTFRTARMPLSEPVHLAIRRTLTQFSRFEN